MHSSHPSGQIQLEVIDVEVTAARSMHFLISDCGMHVSIEFLEISGETHTSTLGRTWGWGILLGSIRIPPREIQRARKGSQIEK